MPLDSARLRNNILHNQNWLLKGFEPAVQSRLEAYLKPVNFKPGSLVCEAGETLEHAYFPECGALSLLTVLENGSAVETASIGREGAFGIFAVMSSKVSFSRCVVKVEGPMTRCPIEPLRAAYEANGHLRERFAGFSEALLSQVQQTAVCYALHSTEQRLARSILTMHDYAAGDTLNCTHEFLSQILGANRKSITLAAQSLQIGGLIRYRRGLMEVQDRRGLGQVACECYGIIKSRHTALHGQPPTAGKIPKQNERSVPPYANGHSTAQSWIEDPIRG